MTLGTPGVPSGLPVNVVARGILNSNNLAQSIQIIGKHQLACAFNYMISTNDGEVVSVEVVLDDYDVLYPDDGICVHSNHYLSQRLLQNHPDTMRRYCSSTHLRYGRTRKLLKNTNHPLTTDDFARVFSDHADHPESICWHPDPAITTPYAQLTTVCSVIMDTTDGVMLATQGNPCSNPYQQFLI